MTTNAYFSHGTSNEKNLVENLLIEAIKRFGYNVFYIPRNFVALDELFGEDNLSEFKYSFPIEMYFETNQSWGGDGNFLSKFGLEIQETAIFVIAKRRWKQVVEKSNKALLNRPSEGDLVYFPVTKSLFEIKFVDHQSPFYQLSQLPVYKLTLETFRFSQEVVNTPDFSISEDKYYDIIQNIIILENGNKLLLENGFNLVKELFNVDEIDGGADNTLFHTEDSDNDIIVNIGNPFGNII